MRALALLVIVVLGCACPAAEGGQLVSHALLAERLLERMPPPLRAVCERHRMDYMAGAQGPDIAGVGADLQKLATVGRERFGWEAHYEKTGHICVALLQRATTERQLAFAVGWITHYLNDLHIHALVNQYGGLYDEAVSKQVIRHKALEILESYHIFADGRTWSEIKRNWNMQGKPGEVDTMPGWCDPELQSLVRDVFKELFGGAYAEDHARVDFGYSLKTTADTVREAARLFRRTYENGGGALKATSDLDVSTKLAAWKLPRMPTREEFEWIQRGPLELIDTNATEAAIRVRIRATDTKLFGRFLEEWKLEMTRAVDESDALLSLLGAYYRIRMEGRDSFAGPAQGTAEEKEIVAALRAHLPDINLDNPPLAPYRTDAFWPGDEDIREIYYSVDVTWVKDGQDLGTDQFTGLAALRLSDEAKGYQGSRCGVADLELPLAHRKASAYRYVARLHVVPPYEATRRGRPILDTYDILTVDGAFGAPLPDDRKLQKHVEKWRDGTLRFVYTYYEDAPKNTGGGPFSFTPRVRVHHGQFTAYEQGGSVRTQGRYVHGKKEGQWTELDGYGSGRYVDGKREGLWLFKTEEGVTTQERNFSNGLLEGVSRSYSVGPGIAPGTISQEWHYHAGELDGPYREFDFYGRPKLLGHFRGGKPSGTWTNWRYDSDEDRIGKPTTKPAPSGW